MPRSVVDLAKLNELDAAIEAFDRNTGASMVAYYESARNLLSQFEAKLSELEMICQEAMAALRRCESLQKIDQKISCASEDAAFNRAYGRYKECEELVKKARRAIFEYSNYAAEFRKSKNDLCTRAKKGINSVRSIIGKYTSDLITNTDNVMTNGEPNVHLSTLPTSSEKISLTKIAIDKNNKDLEKALGIKKGPRMTISEADKQNANPKYRDYFTKDPNGNYYKHNGEFIRKDFIIYFPEVNFSGKPRYSKHQPPEEYGTNCATTSTAFVLRLRGFDVKAKGNTPNSLNKKIATTTAYLDLWRNPDGTKVKPVLISDWMKKKGIKNMTPKDYRSYFDEACQKKGVYVVMVRYAEVETGHATIFVRNKNGLHYIEPQVYDKSRGEDGKRSIDDLLLSENGKLKLSKNPAQGYGVLRVDNKIFNPKYAAIFETK